MVHHVLKINFFSIPEGVTDTNINKLARFRQSKSGKSGKNSARDFHRFVRRDGRLFDVQISTPQIPIRRKVRLSNGRRRTREKLEKFPCILMSSWVKSILETCPKFLLGGNDPSTAKGLQKCDTMFLDFWQNFKSVQPSHPIYSRSQLDQSRTIPIALHGDEGRGLGKVPILVLSYQVLIPFTGPECLNSTKPLSSIWLKFWLKWTTPHPSFC